MSDITQNAFALVQHGIISPLDAETLEHINHVANSVENGSVALTDSARLKIVNDLSLIIMKLEGVR